jgi:HlyD family secretion protein
MKIPRVRTLLFTGIVALSATGVARLVLAETPVAPRASDAESATRRLASDAPLPMPEGDWVNGAGVVEPRERETRVATDVPGVVSRVVVVEGSRVAAGDPLVELTSDVAKSVLQAAEADVRAATAELAKLANGNRMEDRRASVADVDAAEARAASAREIAARLAAAARGGGATPDEVERARRQAESDEATASAARARRDATLSGARSEEVAAARARLEATTARRDEARVRLDERTVRAPLHGEVLAVKIRAGEYATPGGDALVVLGDTSEMKARIDVDEREIARLGVGARAKVRVPALPGRELEGRVETLGRRMGRKNVRTDDPVERNDAKILEVVLSLGPARGLVVGQRVTGFVEVEE